MREDRVNKWLTLGANVGVLIGIILLLVELSHNSTIMKAQISSERADQAIDLYMAVAGSEELIGIEVILQESGFPGNVAVLEQLSRGQKYLYLSYLKAQRARIENVLYQESLGVLLNSQYLARARELLPKLKAFGSGADSERLEQLIQEAEEMSRSAIDF